MIRARGLRKEYPGPAGPRAVLADLDLEVSDGEFVVIVGASGSGKSTLLHILGGLDAGFGGELEIEGRRLNGLSDEALAEFRRRKVGFVFQSFHLIPQLTAVENVRLPEFFWREKPSLGQARAEEMLARVGLATKAGRLPPELSGGERQRVAIARALFAGPPLLLCDEPTGNLDAATGQEIIELFSQLHRAGQTVVAVTHEDRLTAVGQRVLRLAEGALVPAAQGGAAA